MSDAATSAAGAEELLSGTHKPRQALPVPSGSQIGENVATRILDMPRTQAAIRKIVERTRQAAAETEEQAYQRLEMFDDGTHEAQAELAQSLCLSSDLREIANALERKA